MPTRLCTHPGCPTPATYRGRCPDHARQRNTETHRNRSIYNSAKWRHTRKRVLFLNPLCSCGGLATDVHHVKDIEDGGDPWASHNLAALCHSCHSTVTKRQMNA